MLKRGGGALLLFPTLCALLGCGIDEYIYLEPATKVDFVTSDSLRVKVRVPEQSEYFDEYLIYYRIYPTTSYSILNSQISSNISTIENANENSPENLETVLKNLSFKTIAYAEDTQSLENIIETENPLTSNDSFSFEIEFNLSSSVYPYLQIGTDNYRLLRNSELELDAKNRDLLLSAVADSYPAGSSDRPLDVVASSSYTNAHVLLVIVASGHDTSFSLIHSTALEIGAFPLN
jgi:hypothetical protein